MLVVSRFAVGPDEDAGSFAADLSAAYALLAARPGFEEGRIGRNVDDPGLWVLVTRWRDVGSYRRALSSYEVKAGAVTLLARALDEPSAYEILDPLAEPAVGLPHGWEALNEVRPREL